MLTYELQLFEVNYSTFYSLFSWSFITDAVQAKFGLLPEELAVVWTSMLECIKSKRRNIKAKLQKELNKSGMSYSIKLTLSFKLFSPFRCQ